MRTDAPYLSSLLLSEVRVEAPSRDVTADRIGVVSVATEDEEFASDVTQLRVGVVVHGMGAGGSTREQFLHLRAPIAVVVVAFRFVTHEDDAHFRGMAVEQAAKRAQGVVHIEVRRDDAVIDAESGIVHGGAQIEGSDAAIPLFRQRFLLRDGIFGAAYHNHKVVHAMTCSGIVCARDGELAEEGIVGDVCHPCFVACPDIEDAKSRQQSDCKKQCFACCLHKSVFSF